MKSLKEAIHLYLEKHPPTLRLFRRLEEAGDIYLIGGVLREFKDNGDILELRDLDLVIDIKNQGDWENTLSEFPSDRNCFDGYKWHFEDLVIDAWPIDETWAYRNGVVVCKPENWVECLGDTVFLSIDAIVYDLKEDVWYDKKYQETMKSGMLDIVLEDNPQVLLNLVRAMILRRRYALRYSAKLLQVFNKVKRQEKNLVFKLMQIQRDRYKKEILTEEELLGEIDSSSLWGWQQSAE